MKCVYERAKTCCDCNFVHMCVFAAQELCTKCVLLHFHCHSVQSGLSCSVQKIQISIVYEYFQLVFCVIFVSEYVCTNNLCSLKYILPRTCFIVKSTEFENPGSIIW